MVVLPDGVAWDGPPVAAAVAGGATRAESVRAGLAAVPDRRRDRRWCTTRRGRWRATRCSPRDRRGAGGADGAVPGLAISDTIKRVAGDRVIETVPRDELVTVQTPQAFRAGCLRAAHAERRGGDR